MSHQHTRMKQASLHGINMMRRYALVLNCLTVIKFTELQVCSLSLIFRFPWRWTLVEIFVGLWTWVCGQELTPTFERLQNNSGRKHGLGGGGQNCRWAALVGVFWYGSDFISHLAKPSRGYRALFYNNACSVRATERGRRLECICNREVPQTPRS